MTGVPIKTSKYDFSLPTRSARSSTAPKSSKSNASSKGKKPCYYYYIYRKKINPLDIKSPNDLPIPLMFRSKNVKFEQVTENDDISMQVGSTRNLSPIKRNPAPKSTNKRHTRSSSLPDLKKQSREQLPTVQSKHKSILKSQSNTPRASNPLPRITTTAVSPSSSLSKSDGENLLKSGISVPSLLNLIPVDGMQWSRHTTITKTPTGVSEKTINVETRKIKRDGKWVEESIKMTTIKDQTGSRTQSTKSSFRALKPEEIDALITDGNHRPSSAPIPSFNSAGPERPSASQSNSAVKNVKAVDVSMSKPTFKLSRRTLTTSASYIAAMDNKKAQEIFAQEVLEAVNGYRKLHKVDLLTLSIQLKKRASEWAENLAKLERMEHGKQENFGENIYCKTSSQPWFPISGGEVVDNWYSEIEEHNFEEEPTQGYLSTGHFTQLIWSDTREMGVAYARNRNGHMAFVVSYFSPKGNWIGDFSKKVPPPGGFSSTKNERRRTNMSTSLGPIRRLAPIDQARISGQYRTEFSADSSTSSDSNSTKGVLNLNRTSSQTRNNFNKPKRKATGNFKTEFLKAHNDYRKLHGVWPLRFRSRLNDVAQEWANTLAKTDALKHRENNEFGENLYQRLASSTNFKLSGIEPVKRWYRESENYEFGSEPMDLSAGHFTQVVWANTEALGVGIAKSKSGNIYVVANYDPPGNFIGEFSKMVPPPQ